MPSLICTEYLQEEEVYCNVVTKVTSLDREELFQKKKKKKYNKEGTTKKIMIYQCKRKTTKGHHVIENLGSYFHTFLSNYLLHFRRFFLFNERTFLMTLCSNRTVSCHIRD